MAQNIHGAGQAEMLPPEYGQRDDTGQHNIQLGQQQGNMQHPGTSTVIDTGGHTAMYPTNSCMHAQPIEYVVMFG